MDFLNRFKEVIDNYKLIHYGDSIIVSVSGGVDSVTLLDLFVRLQEIYQLTLHVVHVHHGLRGKEADRDQQFVCQLSEKYQISHSAINVDVPSFVKNNSRSVEEAARILRYRSLTSELKRLQFNRIALGHNADDQAETILAHFLRGSGIRGLAGMSIARKPFIRPLLMFQRREIETYASQKGLHYVTDSTNSDLNFQRNKIRHQLIPLLESEFNPALVNTLLRTGEIFRENDRYLYVQAKSAFDACCKSIKKNKIILDIEQFFSYFNAIQVYILYHLLSIVNVDENVLTFSKLKALSKLVEGNISGTRFPVYDNWEFLIDHNELVFHRPYKESFKYTVEVNHAYPIYEGEAIFRSQLLQRDQLPDSFTKDKNIEYIDYDRIKGKLFIRNTLPGDRFIPLNFNGHKKVSDFFTDAKVPLHVRNLVPLLTTQDDIVWIIGYRIDDRFKIRKNSTNILKLQVNEATDG